MKDLILEPRIENLLKERYYLSNETSWSQVAKRLSETTLPEIFEDILNRTFIPSTPTIMNLNTKGERKGTLSSCFILGIEDSMESIMDSMKEAAFVTKAAGGVGYNFSFLRGSREHVKSINAKSGGVLGFIGIFDSVLDGVRQGGRRRGAGMSLLSIFHPDILQFLDAKQKEGVFERSNFSVGIKNEFYEVLHTDPHRTFQTRNVVDKKLNDLVDEHGKTYTYQMLWDKIIHNAWNRAEPGIFNEDISADRCSCKHITRNVFCNPCLTGDTLVYTADGRGPVQIKQLVDENKDVDVFSMNYDGELVVKKMMNPRLTQKQADVYKVTFDSGMTIKATEGHELITTDGNRVQIKDLKAGDSIKSVIRHTANFSNAYSWIVTERSQDYYFIENNGKLKPEHGYIAENKIGRKMVTGEVVHHIDKATRNNSPTNLTVMSNAEHRLLHKRDMKGVANDNSTKVTNAQLIKRIKAHVKTTVFNLMCKSECLKIPGFPLLNNGNEGNKYRHSKFKKYCDAAGVRYIEGNIYHSLQKQVEVLDTGNYDYYLDDSNLEIVINKKCDRCGAEFKTGFGNRHVTYCSHTCLAKDKFKQFTFDKGQISQKYLNCKHTKNRLEKTLKVYDLYKTGNFTNFKKECPLANSIIRPNNLFCPSVEFLKKTLPHTYSTDDLVRNAEENVASFIDKREVSKAIGASFNHKIVSIEYAGKEDVYDGTVEDTHTILIGCHKSVNKWDKESIECLISGQCSEYNHIPYTSCNLGSINISRFVKGKKMDRKALEKLVEKTVIYLNGIIDQNDYPLEKIRKETLNVRPIGLGMMGLAHALYLKGIPYDSQAGYNFVVNLSKFMTLVGMRKSVELAKEHGKSYPYYDHATFMDANARFFTDDEFMGIDVAQLKKDIAQYGIYNSCITSVAPTGSISYVADCSSGMEPVFGLVFTRKIEKENKTYEHVYIVDPVFRKYVESNYPPDAEKIYKYISNNKGSCQGCKLLTTEEQALFKVAGDITPDWHLQILAAVANNISLSVSKTINLPSDCSEKEVSEVFLKAHKSGVIGVTVYRDGCRRGILVHEDTKKENEMPETVAPKRPTELKGEIYALNHKKDKIYVAVGFWQDGSPYEIFVGTNLKQEIEHASGKIKKISRGRYVFLTGEGEEYHLTNGNNDENADALCRILSTALRHGCGLQFLVHQLEKTEGDLTSFSKVISRVLKKFIKDGTEIHGEECPNCKSKLVRQEGCAKCSACGFSKCS